MANIEKGKLTEQQQKFVDAFCEEGSKTFIDKYKSYQECYKADSPAWKSNVAPLFKMKKIQDAIKKQMPKVAYDEYFLRKEYRDCFNEAKKDRSWANVARFLDSMAKTENMFESTTSESDNDKAREKFERQTAETLKKIVEEKERRRNNLKDMADRNGTDNT